MPNKQKKTPKKSKKEEAKYFKRTRGADKAESQEDEGDYVELTYSWTPATASQSPHQHTPEDPGAGAWGGSRSAPKRKSAESAGRTQDPLLGAQGRSGGKRQRRGTSPAAQPPQEEDSDSQQGAQGTTGAGIQGHVTSSENESAESDEGQVVQPQNPPPQQAAEPSMCEKLTVMLFGLPTEEDPGHCFHITESIVNLVPKDPMTRRVVCACLGLIVLLLTALAIYAIYYVLKRYGHWS